MKEDETYKQVCKISKQESMRVKSIFFRIWIAWFGVCVSQLIVLNNAGLGRYLGSISPSKAPSNQRAPNGRAQGPMPRRPVATSTPRRQPTPPPITVAPATRPQAAPSRPPVPAPRQNMMPPFPPMNSNPAPRQFPANQMPAAPMAGGLPRPSNLNNPNSTTSDLVRDLLSVLRDQNPRKHRRRRTPQSESTSDHHPDDSTDNDPSSSTQSEPRRKRSPRRSSRRKRTPQSKTRTTAPPTTVASAPATSKGVNIGTPISSAVSTKTTEPVPSWVSQDTHKSISVPIPEAPIPEKDKLDNLIQNHEDNIRDASKARKAFLKLKIQETKGSEKKYSKKLENLKRMQEDEINKLRKMQEELNKSRHNVNSTRSVLSNGNDVIKKLRRGIKDNAAHARLEEMEVLKLAKRINEEKNKLALLEDKQRIFKDRLEILSKERDEEQNQLRTEENKLSLYYTMIEGLEGEIKVIRDTIKELETEKAKNDDMEHKLEIEMGRSEGDSHLPMFLKYT